MLEKTQSFDFYEMKRAEVNKVLTEVVNALREKGYNPLNQLVGYLISGNPIYITSYKNSRNKIIKLEREKIILALLESYLEI